MYKSGVSKKLALARTALIENITYDLYFDIPEKMTAPIIGRLQLHFSFKNKVAPLVLDFNEAYSKINTVAVAGKAVYWHFENGHIIIPDTCFIGNENVVQISFEAGNSALNRNDEYLYTLFVPDRASTAFPCFDQPDIKGKYKLSLKIPENWEAVANGRMLEKRFWDGKHLYVFNETKPISTYLFAFVVGKFSTIHTFRNGRAMTMYHRETDTAKVAANQDAIYDLHASALSWLENYTNIPLPFEKFDFVLIPSFQFGGMEHVGSILYKSSSLMLDPSATQNQQLGRASLIAHETAHMWFGDLVTMQWFNDVWLKEVFANFMAAKIVNPNFPEINHQLRFLLAHHPAAYSEDRTLGAHPIQQELGNLKNAGMLYGRIIYQKAPIVMNQLEQIVGEEAFKEGLREYLAKYAYSNASWDDLIKILDDKVPINLREWSEAWVKEGGMPHFTVSTQVENNEIKSLKIRQKSTTSQGKFWQQHTNATMSYGSDIEAFPVVIDGKSTELKAVVGKRKPDFILPNSNGMGYGFFNLDKDSKKYLIKNVYLIEDDLLRGGAWTALYEEMLREGISYKAFMQAILKAIPYENEPLNTQNILGYLDEVYWKFYRAKERKALAPTIEDLLWKIMDASPGQSAKSAYFKTYLSIAQSEEAITRLKLIWEGDLLMNDIVLSENDFTKIACELALRDIDRADDLLQRQIQRIKNPDRRERLAFIIPALSNKQTDRDRFFESLKNKENRNHEPWVLEALGYLHHPLRAKFAEKYIEDSLVLLEEIQRSGDIFFPKRWLVATFSGHQSKSAAAVVKKFLKDRPTYPYRLKNKILQAADMLFRVSSIGK
ncbi:MAG: M1 family aminopeptidase [Bacteroidota bacterium]